VDCSLRLLLISFLCLAVGILGLQASPQARQGAPDSARAEPAQRVADLVDPGRAAADTAPEAVSRQRSVVREAVKQAYEQPLHFLMAAGPIWLSRYLTAVPWYGWSIIPALAYREWRQWPSNRWWDPFLDAAFQILGVIGATWRGEPGALPRPAAPIVAARPKDPGVRPCLGPAAPAHPAGIVMTGTCASPVVSTRFRSSIRTLNTRFDV
jgi:hypothetical protein